ncbi:5-oxoprolinase subunit PxpA [Arenibacter sp. F20364]|uniref:5-oxoprolinase subunit PxpA n=1 Tax=Arenibacter sp. F20364 TaxID=2926415 RepID=UPI001FF4A9D4|nr:5-oxoprolinase subunit PxpA [Arenibacter sp. F20364]MCK0192147.1 5-oxoprolinase subunit PxpA [Arenibacter sp. F20364]
MIKIDINCDVGEGLDNEAQLMPFISSCNIACGGHAGDTVSMMKVARLAKEHHVLVGAHPSYPDRENFGRTTIQIAEKKLKKSILAQIADLSAVLKSLGIELNHIKPHGALYNDIARDRELALLFLDCIEKYKKEVFLYVPYHSRIEEEALRLGFQIKYEAFADRNYNADLSLVSRNEPLALIQNPKDVETHILHMVTKGSVVTPSGKSVKIKADTYCIHGDSPSTLQILMYLSKQLPKNQILIKK